MNLLIALLYFGFGMYLLGNVKRELFVGEGFADGRNFVVWTFICPVISLWMSML